MLNKITLFENGTFEVEEISVLNTKNKSGEESGSWKTINGLMKVSAFEKVNYDSKTGSFYLHTTQGIEVSKINLIYEAFDILQGFVSGYKQQNKAERANLYKRTKSLKRASNSLETIRRLKG